MQEQGSGGGSSTMLRTRPNTIIRGEVQGEYVVRGAKIKCSKALKEEAYDVVNLPLCHGVYSGKEPLINIKDMKDGENIVNGFGICSETGTACVDEMKFHINWINRKKIRLHIEGEQAVTTNSFTMCSAHGGEITFENSGQTAVYHPKNEKAKDELLTPKETSPYKTTNIQNTIIDEFENVFSGLGTIKACESAIKYLGQVWKEAEGHPKIQEEIHNLANKIRKQILFIGKLTSVDEEYLDSIRRQIESGDGADPLTKNDKEISIANYEKISTESIEPIATEELEVEYNKLIKKLNEASIIFTKMQSKDEVKNNQVEVNDDKNHISPYLQNREFWVERCDDWIFPVVGLLEENPLKDANNFGAGRSRGRTHAGIDLDASVGTKVIAMTDCVVDNIYPFYLETYAIAVTNSDGSVVRYTELLPKTGLKIGDSIKKGEVIGSLIVSEGTLCMLHLEVYDNSERGSLTNKTNRDKSKNYKNVYPMNYERRSDLLDPTGVLYLVDAEKYNKYKVFFKDEIKEYSISDKGIHALQMQELVNSYSVEKNYLILEENKLVAIKPHNVKDGSTTVGFGHYIKSNEWEFYESNYGIRRGMSNSDLQNISIPVRDALEIFKTDINEHSYEVKKYLYDNSIELSQNKFDSLVIYRFNKGNIGAVLNLLRSENRDRKKWYNTMVEADNNRKFEKSLNERRKWQNNIFFDNYYSPDYFGPREDIIIL